MAETEGNGSGALPASGRFERIESALLRIETKLDAKADVLAVERLAKRVGRLEDGESPLGRVLMTQFDAMQAQVNNLVQHGSSQAQEAKSATATLDARVDLLQAENDRRDAVEKANNDKHDYRYKLAGILVGSFTLINGVLTVLHYSGH